MVSYDDKLSHAVIKYYLKTDLANNPLFFSVLRYHNRYYILRSQKGQRKRIILYRQQHNQHLLERQSLRRHRCIIIHVSHNLMLHKEVHQPVTIFMILRYHPQVVIKKGIVHIPLYPSLSRCRCRHFSCFPCQLPKLIKESRIPPLYK